LLAAWTGEFTKNQHQHLMQLPMQNLIKIDKSHINPSYPCPSVQSVVKNSSKAADSTYNGRATSSSAALGSPRATTTAPLPLHFSFSAFQRLSMMFKHQSKNDFEALEGNGCGQKNRPIQTCQ